MASVGDGEGAWLVLLRDVSHAMHVAGHDHLSAAMVLDMETGLLRGLQVAPTGGEALLQALTTATHQPTGPLSPGLPAAVMTAHGLGEEVTVSLRGTAGETVLPDVAEVEPPAEAEDIFDSFIGHMAGRAQPAELPTPEDWEMLYTQALEFYRKGPWSRWHDGIDLAVEIALPGATSRHTGVIMGNGGLQHGLVIYPGENAPAGLDDWEPGQPVAMPADTLLCTLDLPQELPLELTAKARRYGWPLDTELVPVFLRLGPDEEGADLGRRDVHRLTVALAAVTTHDSRGPIVVEPATEATTGTVAFSDGTTGNFSVHQRHRIEEAPPTRFRVHQTGFDLIPDGTPVVVGHLPWASLVALRSAARIHRPFPVDAPRPAGKEVPLVAILPKRSKGDSIAAKTTELDPFGVAVIDTEVGEAVFTLVGANGAEILMEVAADNPSLALYRRRLRQTKGLHVVMIADESTAHGKGNVYGLIECYQPPTPTGQRKPRAPRSSPKRRR